MIMSVDPGVSGTGVALWNKVHWDARELVCPIHVQNIYPPNQRDMVRGDFVEKTHEILSRIWDIVEKHKVTQIWCEFPEFFTSVGGTMVAQTGDLQKLTFFVGALGGYCLYNDVDFQVVEPTEWKGQMKKDMVARKIIEILPIIEIEVKPTTHSWDAVGIGLWAQGLFKR